jgi:archaellum component FlaF (FlaF/FlaG flagellin family)
MKNQLSSIAVQYRKFSKGQYIEDPDQFNEFLDFFEDQDRLSRVLLQGVGIVCGLKPTLIYKNRLLSGIQLSQGAALTTDGDLLTLNNTSKISEDLYMSDLKTVDLENKNFTHFKVYDNFKIKYPAFYEGSEQIELWELAIAQDARSDFQPVNNLTKLEDKYLLLYLEDYEKEVKPCRGVDCDNHGIQQIRNLKVLVTTARGITHILGEDGFTLPDPITGEVKLKRKDRLQPHPLFIEDIMEPVKQNRVILEQFVSDKKLSASDLKNIYIKALDKTDFGKVVFERMEAIGKIVGIPTANYDTFKASFTRIFNQDSGFQYAYDVVKDLMDTYSEIVELLPKAFTKCLPDFVSFPKHIMLGKLISDIQLDFSRHQFYNSPALDDEKATQRVKTLINRFNQQVGYFNPDNIIKNKEKVKITPSQKLNPLSNKAIPFYYTVTENFLKAWNFDKTSNRSSGSNLTFDTDWVLIGQFEKESPLNLNIDNYSFYNIEGHQGMDYQVAFEQIKEIKDKQQLGFDIMLLSLEELKGNKDLSKAYFNEYVEKNSGLEHKRGVKRGGTFILVYDSVRNPKVIADFSLPYICCTPKAIIKLSLPTSVICAESDPIPFTVSPMNGVVKASIGNGVKFINGQYIFDPKAVEEQFYGQEITFTVNGKPTDCSIKVISEPDVKVEVVKPVIYPGGDSTATIVNIKVSGANFADYKYSWDFLGTDVWVPIKPDANGFVSYKYYNLDLKNIPAIRVKVDGSGCIQDVIIRDWYDAPVRLSLATDIICSSSDSIPFIDLFPTDGIVKASAGAEASVVSSNGSYSFNPNAVNSALYGQYITFTVNDKSTNCRIKVIPPPKVNINYTVDYPANGSTETTINIDVSGPYFTEYMYEWDFLGTGQFTPPKPINGKISYKYSNLDPKNIPVIGVNVTGGGCAQYTTIRGWYDAPVQLSLPVNTICSESGSIPFNVVPSNGVVAASAGAEASVVSGAGGYSFNPNLVNPALHGQVITFTVNGKQTNCSIRVISTPKVGISVKSVDYPAGNSNETKVNFVVSGSGFTNYIYSVDGNPLSQPDANGNMSYTLMNVDPKNIPVINVKVSNGECTQTITVRDWYVAIKKIDLSDSVNCCPATLPIIKADAGAKDLRFSLELGRFGLKGSGDGAPVLLYFWSKLEGPDVKLISDPANGELIVEDLIAGNYKFQLLVKDANSDAFSIDTTTVTVY